MPGYRQRHNFEGLGEFRDVIDQLATATSMPVYVDKGSSWEPDGSGTQLNDAERLRHQAIWNNRDDELAYIGTDKYTITQHHDILGVVDEAVGKSVGEIDIGTIRDWGDRIDGMLTLNGHNVDVEALTDDGYVPPEGELLDDRTAGVQDAFNSDSGTVRDILGVGIRFANSFDASERIRFETMGYRYVCQNWMVWGEETIGQYTQLHVDELDMERIESLIYDVVDKKQETERMIVDMIDDRLKWSWIDPFLEEAGFGKNYRKRIIKKLRTYEGVDTTKDIRRWDLYNAITDVLDNQVMIGGDDGVNANVYNRHQKRAQFVLDNEAKTPDEERPVEEIIG